MNRGLVRSLSKIGSRRQEDHRPGAPLLSLLEPRESLPVLPENRMVR